MKAYSLVSTTNFVAFPLDLDMVVTSCVLGVVCLAVSNKFPSHDPSSCNSCTNDSLYSSPTPSCYS